MKKKQFPGLILSLVLVLCMVTPVLATQVTNDPQTTAPSADPTVLYGAHSPDGQHPILGTERILQSATSAVLYEVTSDTLVYTWNPDEQMYPSSLTKIMTALIAIENGDLAETVTVSWRTLELVPENAMIAGLYNQEEVTLEELLYLMMVGSANDAALIIAEHIGGGQEEFVQMMNQRAQELGCTGTVFRNAHGIHEEGHVSTARDIVKIMRKAVEYPVFYEIFCTESYKLEETNMYGVRYFETTNYMGSDVLTDQFYDSRVTGGRTGTTDQGRRNFAATSEKNGDLYISVVLGAVSEYGENSAVVRQGAFEDTGILLDMGLDSCSTVQVVYEGQVLDQLPVAGGTSDVVIGSHETASCVVPRDMDKSMLVTRMELTAQNLTAPVEEGTYVGYYQVYYGSMCIAQVPLYTLHGVKSAPVVTTPADTQEDPGFDPGALTTAFLVLGVIFAVIIVLVVGLLLVRWFNSIRGQSRKQKRRADRRRSR